MYKLVFRGELAEGALRADAIAKLSLLLKQSPERIEQSLFSGKTCVIKRVDDALLAARWQGAFAKAGAVLSIVEEVVEPASVINESFPAPDKIPPDSPVQSSLPPPSQSDASPPRHLRKWLVGSLVCLIVLVAGAAVMWQQGHLNRWLLSAVSDEEKTLHAAMADPQLLAIARVDLELMRKLDPEMANVEQLHNLPGADTDLWRILARPDSDIPQQATQVYAVALATNTMEVAIVARGNFAPEKITRVLNEHYRIDRQDGDGIWLVPPDTNGCVKHEPLLAQLSQGQLLIGAPAAVKRIALRLNNKAQAGVDLTHWQQGLGGKLFSLAIFSPARWRAEEAGIVQYALGKMAAEMGPVTEVYLDAEPDLVSKGVNINLSLISRDQQFINNTHKTLQTTLDKTRQQIAQDWPEVSAIYDRLQLNHSAQQLQASIRFDQQINDELSALLSSMLSISAATEQSAVVQQEVIDENPARFAKAHREQLIPFAPQDDFMDAVYKTAAGPFGLGVESLALQDGRIQVKVGVKAYDLPNLGNENSSAFLVVTDVLDQQGNSLLALAPACGESDPRAPEAIQYSYAINRIQDGQFVPGRALTGGKTIALPAGVNLGQVARIKGYIDYHLPLDVETKIVDAPLAGKLVDLHGTRIRFKSTGASSLRFEYSGATEHLLQVNALNAANKPLSSSSAMRSSLFWGSGKSASLDFKGTVEKAEIVVASAIENQRYDFELNRIAPPEKAFVVAKAFPEPIREQQFEQFIAAQAPVINEFPFDPPKTSVSAAPALLAISDVRTNNAAGLSIEGAVYTDIALPLYERMSVAQLYMEQVQDAGAQHYPVNTLVPLSFERQGGITLNNVYQPDEKTPWLRADFSLKAADIRTDNIKQLRGELRFFLPSAVHAESVPFTLGPVWTGTKSSLQLHEWKTGRLVFSVQGAYDEIVGLKAFDGDGKLISQPPYYSAVFGEPQLIVEISELPVRLEVETAAESQELVVPFDLAMPEG